MRLLTRSFLYYPCVLLCSAAAVVSCSLGTARAQSVLSLATPAMVSVAPGGTFAFTLDVSSSDVSLSGMDYNLLASNAGLFEITDRSLTGSVFNNPITANNALFVNGASLALSPGEPNNLGAFSDAPQTAPFNAVFVATYTVRALTTASPGTYSLTTTNESASDDQFNTVALTGTRLTINVVPEPQAGHLLMAGAVILAALAYRRAASLVTC